MSYNYHRQFDHHHVSRNYEGVGRSAQYLPDQQQLSRPRRATCWDPPGSRDPPGFPPYDQPPPRHMSEPYGPPQPHRMGSVQTRRPSCWEPPPCRASRGDSDYDQPVQQIWSRPPPYNGPYMEPNSDLQPRQSYARYRSWQPQYQPRSATKAEDPINAKLDRLLEACDKIETWFDATNRRISQFRSLPRPEPDLDQPNVSAPLRKMAYPPSRNGEASFGPSRLVPNESTAPPRQRTIEYTNRRSDFQSPQRSSMTSHYHSVAPPPSTTAVLSSNLPQPAPSCSPDDDDGKEGGLLDEPPPPIVISSPCSPYIMGEDESPLDDEEEVDSIEEVKKAVVARVTSQDVIENCLGENGDLHDSNVARMIHRPTLLAIDARMIPPQNYTACLGIHGCVDKLHVLALNFDDCFDPTLMIFYGKGEVTRPTVRWAFDPGGDTSSKLLRSTLCCFVVSTLRTRWILTGGELIRSSSSLDLLGI